MQKETYIHIENTGLSVVVLFKIGLLHCVLGYQTETASVIEEENRDVATPPMALSGILITFLFSATNRHTNSLQIMAVLCIDKNNVLKNFVAVTRISKFSKIFSS